MRPFVILTAVLLLVTPAYTQNGERTSEHSAAFTREQREDIREAVFRHQFRHNSSIQGSKAAVYCLSVENGADPSDDLVKRFEGYEPAVRKVSDCSTDPFKGVVEKSTGKRGIVFRVKSIKWISSTKAEVSGGYFEYGLSASGNTYFVKKSKAGWRVAKDTMNWLS